MSGAAARAPARWIGLAGPTASGKSGVAMRLAQHLPIEIVSVDSALVYRGMDIGTAKPDAADRAAVAHHLIDIIDPALAYSAAAFVADARVAIDAIQARGRIPLLVGGTMLYFHALLHGLDELPPASAALRARIDAEAAARGWPAMHARLAEVDAASATRLSPHDAQRIQRALEVYESTGRPLSSWHSQPARGSRAPADRLVCLEPASRAWLHERIAARFDAMLARGFVGEVRALRARGDLRPSTASMRCVGYRQAWQALDATPGVLDTPRLEQLRSSAVAATRQLAKRQITWLRSMTDRLTVACDDEADAVFARVLEAVRARAPACSTQ
jgi:tRNA dimethylallyltransferase